MAGDGCCVISNDEMRDHHLNFPNPRAFLRWKERHVAHFQLGGARLGGPPGQPPAAREPGAPPPPAPGGPTQVWVERPPCYSRMIQEAPCGTWHFPSAEADSTAWVLARPRDAPPAP